MSDKSDFLQRSAALILQLYEQRREPTLRSARMWFVNDFHPAGAKDIATLWVGAESSSYRMVTTYWEMAATFVVSGAIDAAMFHAANTEYAAVYAKLAPHLAELRKLVDYPDYLANLETVATEIPDKGQKMAAMKKFLDHPARKQGGMGAGFRSV